MVDKGINKVVNGFIYTSISYNEGSECLILILSWVFSLEDIHILEFLEKQFLFLKIILRYENMHEILVTRLGESWAHLLCL